MIPKIRTSRGKTCSSLHFLRQVRYLKKGIKLFNFYEFSGRTERLIINVALINPNVVQWLSPINKFLNPNHLLIS